MCRARRSPRCASSTSCKGSASAARTPGHVSLAGARRARARAAHRDVVARWATLRAESNGIPVCRCDPGGAARTPRWWLASRNSCTRREPTSCTRTTRRRCFTPCRRRCWRASGGGCTPSTARTVYGRGAPGRRARSCGRCTRVVAVSPQTADVARSRSTCRSGGFASSRTASRSRTFHPDGGARARVRAELGIAADAFVIGSVGRLVAEKDYPLLVRAVAPLLSERVRLVLVGEGDARADIERAIPAGARASRDSHGRPARRPRRCSASFDLFALCRVPKGCRSPCPRRWPARFPSWRRRSAVSRVSCPPTCGVFVRRETKPLSRSAIGALARDRDRCRAMGAASRSYALERFSIERMADAYERIYLGI